MGENTLNKYVYIIMRHLVCFNTAKIKYLLILRY